MSGEKSTKELSLTRRLILEFNDALPKEQATIIVYLSCMREFYALHPAQMQDVVNMLQQHVYREKARL